MPLYDFTCTRCGHEEYNVYKSGPDILETLCPRCYSNMKRMFPTTVHIGVDTSFDGTDGGKSVQEKNEQLKKKWAGYESDSKSLRTKIEEKVKENVK